MVRRDALVDDRDDAGRFVGRSLGALHVDHIDLAFGPGRGERERPAGDFRDPRPRPIEELDRSRAGDVVEVAGDDDRERVVRERGDHRLGLGESRSVVVKPVEVYAHEDERRLRAVDRREQRRARLVPSGRKLDDARRSDGVTREHGHAVLTAVVIHESPVRMMLETGERCEHRGLIDAAGAVGVQIDFLNRDGIRLCVDDNRGDPREVDDPVQSLTVVDVVGHDAQRCRRVR